MLSDPVSLALFFYQNPILDLISIAIDKAGVPFIIGLLALIYIFIKFNILKKLKKYIGVDGRKFEYDFSLMKKRLFFTFVALLLTIASVQFIKLVYPQDRPCTQNLGINKIECPVSSSFPSTHTASAAVLVPFSLGTFLFAPSLLFYLIVAFSRIYLGVHYLIDVLVASAFGFSWYFLSENLLEKDTGKRIASKASNVFRGFLHLFFGLFIMFILTLSSIYSLYPIQISLLVLLFILLFIFYLINRTHSQDSDILNQILDFVSTRDRFHGEGAIWFILGAMFIIGFTQDVGKSIAGVYIVTVGDVASAAFSSKLGKKSLFKNKNLISYLAFVLASIPSILILGIGILPIIFLAALIESLDLKINDNFILFVFLTLSFMFL
ncbi:MAG: phosphatase PAP2 family protein [Candidatus Micrarchaeia archaeon]